MLAAFLTTILFSLSAVTARRTTAVLPPTEANFWRLCVAILFLATYAYGFSYGINPGAFHMLLISGIIGFGIGDVALFHAYPRIGSRLTVMLVHCLAAPFAAATEWVWMGTRLSLLEMVCAGIILAGVAVALAPSERVSIKKGDLGPGVLFGVIAALGQGLGAVQSRRAYELAELAGEPIDGVTVAYQRIIGGVLFSGIWLLMRHRWPKLRTPRPGAASVGGREPLPWRRKVGLWPWIVANGLAGPSLGVSCYQWALKTTPTGVVLPIVAITPIVVIPFAYLMKEERASRRSLLGGGVAVCGAVLLAVFAAR